MTSSEMTWQEAIIKVLEDAEEPLDYNKITRLIGEQGLRSLSGATPASTVSSNLSSLASERKVAIIEKGLYALTTKSRTIRKPIP